MWRSCGDLVEILNGAPLAERNTVTGFPTHLSSASLHTSLAGCPMPTLARMRAVTRVLSGLCGTALWHGARTEPENATSEVIA